MTVFLQQLGRGLRLDQGKDCLTVLDFVAQANRKYDFASRFQALVGRETVSVPREVKEGFPHVPKGCSIQLEEIAQKRSWTTSVPGCEGMRSTRSVSVTYTKPPATRYPPWPSS